jgi:hypothetical protein
MNDENPKKFLLNGVSELSIRASKKAPKDSGHLASNLLKFESLGSLASGKIVSSPGLAASLKSKNVGLIAGNDKFRSLISSKHDANALRPDVIRAAALDGKIKSVLDSMNSANSLRSGAVGASALGETANSVLDSMHKANAFRSRTTTAMALGGKFKSISYPMNDANALRASIIGNAAFGGKLKSVLNSMNSANTLRSGTIGAAALGGAVKSVSNSKHQANALRSSAIGAALFGGKFKSMLDSMDSTNALRSGTIGTAALGGTVKSVLDSMHQANALRSNTLGATALRGAFKSALDLRHGAGMLKSAGIGAATSSNTFKSLLDSMRGATELRPTGIGALISTDIFKSLNASTVSGSALKALSMSEYSTGLLKSLNLSILRSSGLASLGAGSIAALMGVASVTGNEKWANSLIPSMRIGDAFHNRDAVESIARMLSVVQLAQPEMDAFTSVVEAAGQSVSPLQADAIRLAVAATEKRSIDGDATPENFSTRLFVSLAERFGPEVWLPILLTVVLALVAPAWDYYIKDVLGKASQQEDRRAMAKEIAKALVDNAIPPVFVRNRGVAVKALEVRLNAGALSPIVGRLRQGELVHIEAISPDWFQITWRSADGREMSGWVFRRYVDLLSTSAK